MNCETCKERQKQDNPVPRLTHESDMARLERTNNRLWILVIILALMLGGMCVYEAQTETITTTQEVTQEAENGTNHFVGGDYFGETDYHDYDNGQVTQTGK